MKKDRANLILIIVFFIGLSLLLYPTVSDFWNSFHQTRAIASYVDVVESLDEEQYEKMWKDARAYNKEMAETGNLWVLTKSEKKRYQQLLNVSDTGIMGYIDIPSINCSLPVYHGVDEAVLQIAIGHIEGTSLPVGGKGTHAVLSGHRGLPSAKLFSNLDRLKEGDNFMLHVLDETLTYEIDQILIVEPEEIDALQIDKKKDLCTLVTCTPYGINSHRLLVRGHRVETVEQIHVTADAAQIEPMIVAVVVAIPMLLGLLILLLMQTVKKRK